ncbi:MAG TPA: ABC-2 family transporter protein [Mobilitalea sp.]|nr:ABC-2 family transporter protein [Mobilitalea sp.]
MKNALRELKKHIFMYFIFAKYSLLGYMEYKANFYASLTMEIVFLLTKVIYVVFAYQLGSNINGISPDEVMIFTGVYTIMVAIFTGLFMDNFYELPGHIQNGTLDLYITKPLSLQFMVSLRHVNFALPIPNLITGVAMIIIGCKRLAITVNAGYIAGFIGIIISSTIVTYCIFLMPQLLSFWTIKSGSITDIVDKFWEFNNMPMFIYSKWMQRIGTFVIPVFFITNMPSSFLTGRMNTVFLLWVFVAPIIFLIILRLFWNVAIKKYTSASS